MARLVGWTLGAVVALAVSAAPAAAQSWSVGVHIGNGPVYAPGPYYDPYYDPYYYRPVYRAPVYRVPVYRERVYYPYYRPVYRDRVVIVNGRRDNGRHNGWYKHDKRGRGPGWRDDRYYRGRRR